METIGKGSGFAWISFFVSVPAAFYLAYSERSFCRSIGFLWVAALLLACGIIMFLQSSFHERLHGAVIKSFGCRNVEYGHFSLKGGVHNPCCKAIGFEMSKSQATKALLCPVTVMGTVFSLLLVMFYNFALLRFCLKAMLLCTFAGGMADIFSATVLNIKYRNDNVMVETVGEHLVIH